MSGDANMLRVVLEQGKTKVFASAIDWPGWCRSGKKTPDAAIEELLAYRTRYNAVLRLAKIPAIPDPGEALAVIETLPGDATTDYGAPSVAASVEADSLVGDDLDRQLAVVRAAWRYLDQVASEVSPNLQKGPRGGGRDRDKMLDHVNEAERAYVRKVGVKTPRIEIGDGDALERHRAAVEDAIREHAAARDLVNEKWSLRYVIRRLTWHVLDHAWEMEDKDLTREDVT